jgi:anti-anti-sigma factor
MKISKVQHIDGIVVASLRDPVTQHSELQAAKEAARQAIRNFKTSKLVLDLSPLDYANSSTFSILIWIRRLMEQQNGRLAICCVAPRIYETMKSTKLDTVLKVFDTVPEAVTYLAAE